MYYLGVDLGTSSLKLSLADGRGAIVSDVTFSYPSSFPKPGYSEQNPEDWLKALKDGLARLSESYDLKKIRAVSFSGQMHGMVILDENDRVIRPAILWNDNRTTLECDRINGHFGKEKLVDYTGNIAFTGFTAPKVLWLRENEPENFARIAKLMLPKDYLLYMMGGVFASDMSDSSGTLYFDVENARWSQPMMDFLGIKEKLLPEVFKSFEVVGRVSESFARETGMSASTKLVAGGGDQAVGAVGTGTVADGRLSISLGTSGVIFSSNSDYKKMESGAMHSFRHANGRFHIMGVMLSAAGSNDWWVRSILQSDDYAAVDRQAIGAAAEDLFFLPYLTGERSPINKPEARGAFLGIRPEHTRADMSRAVLEGINFGLLDCYREIQEAGVKATFARVIGGGAKSPVWIQMLSDMLGLELRKINTAEGASLGALILAMTGDGVFANLEEGCAQLIKDTEFFYPHEKNGEIYAEKFERFLHLRSLQEWMK